MTDRAAAVRMCGVGVRRGDRWLLEGVDWEVRQGERWVILGPNGAGKSTLLKVLTGEIFATTGEVEVLGRRLGDVDVRELRKNIGITGMFVNESFRSQIPVVEVVMSAKHAAKEIWWHRYRQADRQRASELLEMFGCGDLAGEPFGNCSSGEKQRILLARTLMAEPELLVLDEPIAGLDLEGRENLLQSLQKIQEGITVLLVTHHVEEIPPNATHILLLSKGKVASQGKISQVLTQENLAQCYATPLKLENRNNRWWSWQE